MKNHKGKAMYTAISVSLYITFDTECISHYGSDLNLRFVTLQD